MKLPHLSRKGNAFYYVTGTTPRRWIPLGSDLAVALRRYERLRCATPTGTLGRLLADWLLTPPAPLAPGTLRAYRSYAQHLTAWCGHLYPDELSRQDILLYLDRCPRTSAMTEISLLRQVYERAIRRGDARDNPCLAVRPERPRHARRTRLLTDDEIAAIRAAARPLLRVAIDLALATGLRPADLCRLRPADLDHGLRTQKTGVRLRWAMTDDLRAILDEARALQGSVRTLTVLGEGGKPLRYKRLNRLWNAAVAEAGVQDAQFRDLRAVVASAEPDKAQQRLGHTTANTTKTYLRGRQVTTVEPLKRRSGGPKT